MTLVFSAWPSRVSKHEGIGAARTGGGDPGGRVVEGEGEGVRTGDSGLESVSPASTGDVHPGDCHVCRDQRTKLLMWFVTCQAS